MTITGFGNSGVGLSPFGIATPTAPAAAVDNAEAARFINLNNGDFELDDNGAYVGTDQIRQRIILTMATQLGSAVDLPTFGSGIFLIKKIDETYDFKLKAAVKTALKQMVDIDKVITVVNITNVRRPGGRVDVTIEYIDLTKNINQTLTTSITSQG